MQNKFQSIPCAFIGRYHDRYYIMSRPNILIKKSLLFNMNYKSAISKKRYDSAVTSAARITYIFTISNAKLSNIPETKKKTCK